MIARARGRRGGGGGGGKNQDHLELKFSTDLSHLHPSGLKARFNDASRRGVPPGGPLNV